MFQKRISEGQIQVVKIHWKQEPIILDIILRKII